MQRRMLFALRQKQRWLPNQASLRRRCPQCVWNRNKGFSGTHRGKEITDLRNRISG